MPQIGKRIEPKEGIEPKIGDKVVYEIIFDDGRVGTMETFISEFDRIVKNKQNEE